MKQAREEKLATGFVPPVSLPDCLSRTIPHKLFTKTHGIVFHTE